MGMSLIYIHTHKRKQSHYRRSTCNNKELGNKNNYKFTPQFLTVLSVEYRCGYDYMEAIMHAYL